MCCCTRTPGSWLTEDREHGSGLGSEGGRQASLVGADAGRNVTRSGAAGRSGTCCSFSRVAFSRAAFTAPSSKTCTGLLPRRHPSKVLAAIAASLRSDGCRRTAEPPRRVTTKSTRRVIKPKLANFFLLRSFSGNAAAKMSVVHCEPKMS